MRNVTRLSLLIVLGASTGCSLEGFDVAPCSLDGKLAFKLDKIEGWLSDYYPRPDTVSALAEGFGDESNWPGVWAAQLKNYGERNGSFDKRPARKLIVYGQALPGWQVAQLPKPLQPGTTYWFTAHDGGRSGATQFVAGSQFKPC